MNEIVLPLAGIIGTAFGIASALWLFHKIVGVSFIDWLKTYF